MEYNQYASQPQSSIVNAMKRQATKYKTLPKYAPNKNKALNKQPSTIEPNKPKYKTAYTDTPQYNKPM